MTNNRSKHARPPAPTGRRTAVLCAAALVLTALAVGLQTLSAAFPRLEAAGFRISREEYLRAMYQARNEVLSEHAAAGIRLTDWRTETALGDPCRLTMERALEILAEYYAVGTLAVERGYLTDAGYGAMLKSMDDINRQRQAALDAGEVVTGLSRFTPDDFIRYRASSLRLQFCNDPENPDTQVSPEELRQRYEADRDNLYRQPDGLELAFLLADAAPGEAGKLEQAFALARDRGDLAAALEDLPELKVYYQQISVQPETYGFYSRSLGDVLLCAADLQTGELSRVFRQENRLCLVQCLERTAHSYVPLEEVQSLVAQSIRESRYDARIAAGMEAAAVRGNLRALYRFTAAQLCP